MESERAELGVGHHAPVTVANPKRGQFLCPKRARSHQILLCFPEIPRIQVLRMRGNTATGLAILIRRLNVGARRAPYSACQCQRKEAASGRLPLIRSMLYCHTYIPREQPLGLATTMLESTASRSCKSQTNKQSHPLLT